MDTGPSRGHLSNLSKARILVSGKSCKSRQVVQIRSFSIPRSDNITNTPIFGDDCGFCGVGLTKADYAKSASGGNLSSSIRGELLIPNLPRDGTRHHPCGTAANSDSSVVARTYKISDWFGTHISNLRHST